MWLNYAVSVICSDSFCVYLLEVVKSIEAVAQGQAPEVVTECQTSTCEIL